MPFTATVPSSHDRVSRRRAARARRVRDVLDEWNSVNGARRGIMLFPLGWETDVAPEMGDEPQKIINKRILKDADLLVGIFWTRLGTPTSGYASGAVEEIEETSPPAGPRCCISQRRPRCSTASTRSSTPRSRRSRNRANRAVLRDLCGRQRLSSEIRQAPADQSAQRRRSCAAGYW